MKLYDLMKEYGIPAKESKTRLNNKQIEVNGESQGADYDLGNVTEVYDQGFFLQKLSEIPVYKKFETQLMFIGLANLMSGESNIENELTDFLKDYKMIQISKDTSIFIKTDNNKPSGNKVNIQWYIEGGKKEREFKLPKEIDNSEMIDKLKINKANLEKQLSNQGFLNNAPKFKVDQAKNRLENINKKLAELGINEKLIGKRMIYLKTYELFGFGSKKSKTWQQKFDDIYNFYLKNKNKEDISVIDLPHADVKDNDLSISQGLDNHLVFYGDTGRNHNWELVDFSEADYADPKSDKGVYKITPEIYEEYKKKIQEISDWLDERSEKSFGKSHSSVSDDGLDLDFDETDIALEEVSDKIKKELKLIGKEYEFEISYHLWTSNSTNKLVVERKNLKINDLKVGFGGGRFYCQLFTKDPFDKNAEIWLEDDSCHEYYDLEENKWPYDKDNIIRMNTIKDEMTRKQERESNKNRKYPYAFSYDVTPCEWNSMELIKEITSLLKEMNNSLKNQ